MKTLITAVAAILLLTSCTIEDNADLSNPKPPQEIKHDSIPEKFRGQWTETYNNRIIVTLEADTAVMDLTDYGYGIVVLDAKTVNAVDTGGQGYHLDKFTLSNGTVGVYIDQLTISVAGKVNCITRLKRYVPETEEPSTPEPPKEEPVIIPAA